MNAQEVYDKVVAHLRKQNAKSRDETGCLYRGPDGLMCAIGCLIPDDQYRPIMEGWNIMKVGDYLLKETKDLIQQHERMLYALQRTHDHTPVPSWEVDFQCIAKEFGVVYTPPEVKP